MSMHDPEFPYPTRRRPPEPEPESESGRGLAYALLLVTALGIGVLAYWLGGLLLNRGQNAAPPLTDPNAQPRETVPNGPLDAEETEANNVFEACKGSVVNVDTVTLRRDPSEDRLLELQTVTGSGFIWDSDGRIVTNYHVVEEAVKRPGVLSLRVVFADRSRYEAVVVGTAPNYDLAVIQVPGAPKEKFKPLGVARSNDLKVGQKAFAIGNPFGLSLTMTKGIISNVDRTIESPTGSPIPGVIQHSAAINPGNSGGPLLNRFARLIGVNTSIPATRGGGNVGIGFAVPSDTVNTVVTEIIKSGRLLKPDLGVRLYDERVVRRAGYEHGVMIGEVIPGGPADRAGLQGVQRTAGTQRAQPGDLILSINGEAVDDSIAFQRAVAKLRPGNQATLKILRTDSDGEHEMNVTVTVRGA